MDIQSCQKSRHENYILKRKHMYMTYAIPLFATVLLLLASISPAAQEAPSTGREADNVGIDAKKIDRLNGSDTCGRIEGRDR